MSILKSISIIFIKGIKFKINFKGKKFIHFNKIRTKLNKNNEYKD